MTSETSDLEINELSWFHPNIKRHTAESLLMHNADEGTYLLRESSTQGQYALSVRGKDAVKHFTLEERPQGGYKFGMAEYESLRELVKHFNNQPLIGGESGVLTLLTTPYPRDVDEPMYYETVKVHAELGGTTSAADTQANMRTIKGGGSKEGFLTKKGALVENWKTRWFVLVRNELKYFKERTDEKPKRTLNLNDCIACNVDTSSGKPFSFHLVFKWRTFVMYASSEEERKEWMKLINWKLKNKTQEL